MTAAARAGGRRFAPGLLYGENSQQIYLLQRVQAQEENRRSAEVPHGLEEVVFGGDTRLDKRTRTSFRDTPIGAAVAGERQRCDCARRSKQYPGGGIRASVSNKGLG